MPWVEAFFPLGKYIYIQSHYREVRWWEIFMEEELRFGLDLGRLALLKKKFWPIMSNFLGWFFSNFHWQKKRKKTKNIVGSALKSYIK